jgi:DNA polymerase III delta subunit
VDNPTVSAADVDAVTSVAAGGEPFDLVTAIQNRSPSQVSKAVEKLRSDKNAAFPTAVVVLNTLNDLCAIADALERQWLVGGQWKFPHDQMPQRLARLNGWFLTKVVEAAKRYTLNELRAARHYAVEMRFKLVDSTAQDPWAIVEPVLLRIVARRRGR